MKNPRIIRSKIRTCFGLDCKVRWAEEIFGVHIHRTLHIELVDPTSSQREEVFAFAEDMREDWEIGTAQISVTPFPDDCRNDDELSLDECLEVLGSKKTRKVRVRLGTVRKWIYTNFGIEANVMPIREYPQPAYRSKWPIVRTRGIKITMPCGFPGIEYAIRQHAEHHWEQNIEIEHSREARS